MGEYSIDQLKGRPVTLQSNLREIWTTIWGEIATK